MTKLNPEIIKAAKSAKSPAELSDILGVNGVKVSLADADRYFAQLKARELSDDELSNIAGGGICDDRYVTYASGYANRLVKVVNGKKCPACGGVYGATKISTKVAPMQSSSNVLEVRCRECDVVILEAFYYSDVEFV